MRLTAFPGKKHFFSGKLTFDDTAVMRSGRNTAKNDMAEILSQNYTEGAPDIICTGADDLASILEFQE